MSLTTFSFYHPCNHNSIGLIVGLVICSILLVGTIASAVNAVIVLFAEGPAEFEKNYPELSAQMREAYLGAYPDSIQ